MAAHDFVAPHFPRQTCPSLVSHSCLTFSPVLWLKLGLILEDITNDNSNTNGTWLSSLWPWSGTGGNILNNNPIENTVYGDGRIVNRNNNYNRGFPSGATIVNHNPIVNRGGPQRHGGEGSLRREGVRDGGAEQVLAQRHIASQVVFWCIDLVYWLGRQLLGRKDLVLPSEEATLRKST